MTILGQMQIGLAFKVLSNYFIQKGLLCSVQLVVSKIKSYFP